AIPRALIVSMGDLARSSERPPFPKAAPTTAVGFRARSGITAITFIRVLSSRFLILITDRLRLVEVTSNCPARVFLRFAPVVPVPLIFAWAVTVPATCPLRSGWNVLTRGANGTDAALKVKSYL